jgi:hypothetical protein
MSSGMSSQVSSGGWSGVVSMAPSVALAVSGAFDDDACVSDFCSLFVLLFSSGGGFGGCAEDMAKNKCVCRGVKQVAAIEHDA